jgi:hypothetical protein
LYRPYELRNAALLAHHTWLKVCRPALPFKDDPYLVERLNIDHVAALEYASSIQVDNLWSEFHEIPIEAKRYNEVIVPETPYLFYILETTNEEQHGASKSYHMVLQHLREPEIHQRWELPFEDFLSPWGELPLLTAVMVDHMTIRLALLRPGPENW